MITEYELRDMAHGTGAWRLRIEWLNMKRGASSPLNYPPRGDDGRDHRYRLIANANKGASS